MNTPNRNAWTAPTRSDSLLNGALLAVGVVGVLLAVLDASAMGAALTAFAFA